MKRLLYIDTFSSNHMHEMFDASSLKMFCSLYDVVEYRANRDSIVDVEHLLGGLPDNVKTKSINLVNIYKPIHKLRRFVKQLQAVALDCWFIATAPKDTDVVINYMFALTLYPINFTARMTGRRVLVVCHSDMQVLQGPDNSVSWLFRKSINMFRRKDVKIADNLWFAVLGEAILANVKPLLSEQMKEKMLTFDHTAIFDRIPKKTHTASEKLVLGFVGGLRASKGGDVFLKLAEHFKDNPQVEFRIIGHTGGNRARLEAAGVVIPDGVGDFFISRELMYECICSLDYVLYCFPPQGYRFTASGTVFDAIDCERPILAIRNDYFSGMFKTCGDFGYLEDDYEHLVKRIEWLLETRPDVTWDISHVKDYLRPESAAERFASSKWFNTALAE